MGESIRYGWYKGFEVHVCSTPEGVVLSYVLTTTNVHDNKIAPVLLQDIQNRNTLFSVADAAYDSQSIFSINPIKPRWYGQNRYLLHVQLVFLIPNIAYLF